MANLGAKCQIVGPDEIANAFYVYHFDEAYTQRCGIRSFKAIINYLLLLADRIVILDSFILNNDVLARFLEETGYEYLEEGLIIPARRSIMERATPFEELHQRQKQNKNIHLTDNHLHIQRLDELSQTCILWNLADISNAFENTLYAFRDRIFEESPFQHLQEYRELRSNGFLNSMLECAILDREKLGDRFLARIHFDHSMQSLHLAPEQARALKRFIDTVHFSILPGYMSLNAFYPNEFEKLLGPIRDIAWYTETVGHNGKMDVSLLDSVDIPVIDLNILEQIDIRDLIALRATPEFAAYKMLCIGFVDYDAEIIRNYFAVIQEIILNPRSFAKKRISQSSKFMLWKSEYGFLATLFEQVVATIPALAVLQGIVLYLKSKSFKEKASAFEPLLNRQLISGVSFGSRKIKLRFDKVLRKNAVLSLPLSE